jgi:MFS family permease
VLTGIWGTLGCISTITAASVVDKLGRRPLLFIAYGFMIPGGIMLVALWACFENTGSTNYSIGKAVIFGMFFYGFGYGGFVSLTTAILKARANDGRSTLSSLLILPRSCSYCKDHTGFWSKLTENRPTSIRATGTATGYAIFNIIVILLTQITPLAIEEISWRYFLIFVICDAIFIVIFVLFYPETKNKTLEEIAALFGDEVCYHFKRSWWVLELTINRLLRLWMKLERIRMRLSSSSTGIMRRTSMSEKDVHHVKQHCWRCFGIVAYASHDRGRSAKAYF